MGRWGSTEGFLLSLTFDPKLLTRAQAWGTGRGRCSEFIRRVNIWRKRHGMPKAKFISTIESQTGTGYPHFHLVFPHLRWLAPIDVMTEYWHQGNNAVDMAVRNSIDPTSYVLKYITKLSGWSDLSLSYIWLNRTRLYSLSQDYRLPDYSDKKVAEWQFRTITTPHKIVTNLEVLLSRYPTIEGLEPLYPYLLNPGSISSLAL